MQESGTGFATCLPMQNKQHTLQADDYRRKNCSPRPFPALRITGRKAENRMDFCMLNPLLVFLRFTPAGSGARTVFVMRLARMSLNLALQQVKQ